ncbi:hypothetical protein GYMLUDRAFT_1026956 [Collybiopsis luxurians FD-317 M1]|uniref:Uncharacterized protein n=1 Tax=Collybiopsis luxurians FD-317 M1 TaxID=944289 RepID=A0A0D0BEX0_9AGAR|nr:hypothetical protein GYMLUDRAFT_1026956 [Collybiopsis luxurians FD-317 M1]
MKSLTKAELIAKTEALKNADILDDKGQPTGKKWYEYYEKATKIAKFLLNGENIMKAAGGILAKKFKETDLGAKLYKAFAECVVKFHQDLYANLTTLVLNGQLVNGVETLLDIRPSEMDNFDFSLLKGETDAQVSGMLLFSTLQAMVNKSRIGILECVRRIRWHSQERGSQV